MNRGVQIFGRNDMLFRAGALAFVLGTAVPSGAFAAMETRLYEANVSGLPGPGPLTTLTFSWSFDPAVSSSHIPILQFSSTSSYASYNPGDYFLRYDAPMSQFVVEGLGTPGIWSLSNDFFLFFRQESAFEAPEFTNFEYSVATDNQIYTGTVLSLTQLAVPEPATWAMMIFGMGAVGAMMRRYRATALHMGQRAI
jgi:hypothetical protein